jgi:hypothetical protein
VLINDRNLKEDALRNRGDCSIIERTDTPTAEQVAVIWVDEDGLAPKIHGCDFLALGTNAPHSFLRN